MPKTPKSITPPIGRFIDPLTDFGFKRIFGSEPNKDLLIAFLNELFKGRKVIKDLVYNPQENSGPAQHFRKTIFDLTCTGADGETFIIEMQRAEQKFFTDRAIFYTSRKLYEQGRKGERNWDFELKEVYFIALMDFSFDNALPGKYLHRVRLAEEETGKTFYDKLGFIFLTLPNFNLEEAEIKTGLERWMYVLCNMSRMEKIPIILHKRIFQKLFHIAEVANLKKEEYMMYEKALLDKWTDYSVRKTAQEKMTTAREKAKAAQEKAKAAQEETKAAQEKAKAAQEETKAAQEETKAAQEKAKAAQEEAKAAQEETKAAQEKAKIAEKKGLEKGKIEVVYNLITKLGMTDSQAADVAGVSIAFVKKIKASFKKKK